MPPSTSGPSARAQVALWPQRLHVDGSTYRENTAAGSPSASSTASIVKLTASSSSSHPTSSIPVRSSGGHGCAPGGDDARGAGGGELPSGLAAAAELWLPRLERPEAEGRPCVVDRDLADGPEPEVGQDRPGGVGIDIGLVALGVEDPQVAGSQGWPSLGREAGADGRGVVG